MHKRNRNYNMSYYAKILFVISITLLVYGFYLEYRSSVRLFDPVEDVKSIEKGDDSSITITTADGSEIISNTDDTQKENNDAESTNTAPTNTSDNSKTPSSPRTPSNSRETGSETSGSPNVQTPTIEEINNSLRVEIEKNYGISVKYGAETEGYSVGGFSTAAIYDSSVINNQLNTLRNTLNYYPSGLFTEIKNGGIPLSIYLVNNYSNNNITGVTDSGYSYAVISISASHPFEESFFHESYHYIERFLFKKGANFNTWDSINPGGFTYGVVDHRLSYTYGLSADAPFVNDYAQTSAAEDRASTFEYMMAGSKASCLNAGTIVHEKAMQMALTMDVVLATVSPNVTEYWERYL